MLAFHWLQSVLFNVVGGGEDLNELRRAKRLFCDLLGTCEMKRRCHNGYRIMDVLAQSWASHMKGLKIRKAQAALYLHFLNHSI